MPTATTLKYAPTVEVDLSANKIEFADSEIAGHRVQIDISANTLTNACVWNRAVGSDRPVGSIEAAAFAGLLETALEGTYTDLDAVVTGLSYSTGSIFNAENRSAGAKKANDLVMAYVLQKVYGLSAYDTANKVYNAKDALNMVTNANVADAVEGSINAHNARAGPVDQMFRDLLAADPLRFFDASGNQETGLFETNADEAGSGNWKLTAGDILEIKLEFTFAEQVSRRVVSSQQQPTNAGNTAGSRTETVTEEIVIPANSTFKVRLQIKCT
jgi:hypothetical protein